MPCRWPIDGEVLIGVDRASGLTYRANNGILEYRDAEEDRWCISANRYRPQNQDFWDWIEDKARDLGYWTVNEGDMNQLKPWPDGIVELGKANPGENIHYRANAGRLEFSHPGRNDWQGNGCDDVEFWATIDAAATALGYVPCTGPHRPPELHAKKPAATPVEPPKEEDVDLAVNYATLKHALLSIKNTLETDRDIEEIRRIAAEALEDIGD